MTRRVRYLVGRGDVKGDEVGRTLRAICGLRRLWASPAEAVQGPSRASHQVRAGLKQRLSGLVGWDCGREGVLGNFAA